MRRERPASPAMRWVIGCAMVIAASVAIVARADSFADFNRAVAADDVKTVSQMIARGTDPNSSNEKGEPALLFVAREGSLAMVKALIQGRANVNIRNAHRDTPIMLAALAGDLAKVKLLREARAEINHPGWTPLQYAAFNGHNAVVDYLVSSGADLGLTAPNGATPVMLAVLANKPDTVKLLVSYGLDIDAKNDKGETALEVARKKDFAEVAKILQGAGANR